MKIHNFLNIFFFKRIVKFKFFIFLLLIPFLNSCFELIEEVDMNTDGSGKMTLTLNLSQSKAKVASIMLMDSVNGHKIPSKRDIQQEAGKLALNLRKISGVSKVITTTDFNNYVATASFNFSNTAVLNKTYKEIMNTYKIKIEELPVYNYNKTTSTFSFEYKNKGSQTAYNKLRVKDKEIFKTATYTGIYRFPSTINKVSNANAKISKSQKAVMSKYNFLDIIYSRKNMSNQIQLTK